MSTVKTSRKVVAPAVPAADEAVAKVRKPVPAKVALIGADDTKLTHDDPRLAIYTRKIHKAVKPSDFVSKPEAMRFQAVLFEKQANKFRRDADRFEQMGSIMDNKKAKRLLALQNQMEALKASLAADGQDINALLAAMGLTVPAVATEAEVAG
jgi:hypothetical protein